MGKIHNLGVSCLLARLRNARMKNHMAQLMSKRAACARGVAPCVSLKGCADEDSRRVRLCPRFVISHLCVWEKNDLKAAGGIEVCCSFEQTKDIRGPLTFWIQCPSPPFS